MKNTLKIMTTPHYDLILATDLDGTFLEGDAQTKQLFYSELLRIREHILLIYTTGRPIETVAQFCRSGYLPKPDFVLGDHGTHITNSQFQPVEPLQNTIIQKWNNGNELLKTLLQDEPGISLQPINPPYRVAYYYDPSQLQPQTIQKITAVGYDAILSCDMYLDIVPPNVNKGASLHNLLKLLQLKPDNVITCGDSLNDLSLFQTGLKSIAVGNSEPNLIAAIKNLNLNNVYQSNFPGIAGIIDGLHFYDKSQLFA